MGKIAIMFPGQGSQYTGMGRELFEKSPAARAVFDCAEKIRPGTIEQCFTGSAEELRRTENAQPCLYCCDLAAAAAIKEAGIHADMLAGFSMGELAALAFSGAVSYEDGFRLVCKRAELMQKASETASAGMTAVLKLFDIEVIRLCGEFERVYPVNFNCSGQVVVSGAAEELEQFKLRVKEKGGRAMPLNVGGGFHSPFMRDASDGFAKVLDGFELSEPGLPLYSNATAEPYEGSCRELLAKQICTPVMWRAQVENMAKAGAEVFIEAGPGRTLCGLVTRITGDARVFGVEDWDSLQKTVEGVISGA